MHKRNVIFNKTVTKFVTILTKFFFTYLNPTSYLYQIILIQTLKFTHKNIHGVNPPIFLPKFRKVDHQYLTRFSKSSVYYKKSTYKTTTFA